MHVRLRAPSVTALATVVIGLIAAGLAEAYVLTGTTTRGRAISIITDAHGRLVKMHYAWAVRCKPSGTLAQSARVTFHVPVTSHFFRSMRIGGYQGKYTFHGSVWVRGHKVATGTWRGALHAAVDVYVGARRVDRCRLGPIAWRATTPVAKLQFSGDRNDYITGGRAYSYATPGVPVSIQSGPMGIQIAMGGWMVWFTAGSGHRLHVGTYTGALRDPFNGKSPGLSIFGNGRGCNTATGSFTVTHLRFGPGSKLERFAVSFVQHCDGAAPALRGTFTYNLG